jgi:hypothetical protein
VSRLSIGLRIYRQDSTHTHFDVFSALAAEVIGLDWPDITRGHCGDLTLRTDEFEALVTRLQDIEAIDPDGTHIDVYHDRQDPHPCQDADGAP